MKKLLLFFAISIATMSGTYAAVTLDQDLLQVLPSGQYFLPAPPEIGSLVWQDDSVKYFEYKELARRMDTVRNERWDSVWAVMNEQYYFALYRVGADSVMNAPFLSNLSWTKNANNGKYTVSYTRNTTDFPEMNTLEEMCEQMKTANTSNLWRTRTRPYKYFGGWYKGKYYPVDLNNQDSYPSGHGYFGGLFGMCLMYIDPDNALAIKQMMDEWVECRLLLGAHWNTDLSAGWQLGAMAFAIAMNIDQFRSQVLAAKAELEDYRAQQTTPTGNENPEVPARRDGKMLQDGRLIIQHDGMTYDAQGQLLR